MEKRLTHLPMKRAAAGALAALLLTASAAVALAADATKFAASAVTFNLANGLQVVVIPDHRAPVVTHMVWYRVGAADDPPGKSGIAHFLEHLMFKGTKSHPEGEFSARVEAVGGDDNAFTTEDYTAYHQTVAKDHLKLMMEFEADRMANLEIIDAALIPERQVILEERGMRIDNSPGARLGVAMDAALYENSHYRIPTIGWASEMATLDRGDALRFYDRYYTPNNAIVVVAGDVTEDEVKTLAQETYGKLARRADTPRRVRLREPPADAARLVTLSDPRVTQPSFRRFYLAPSEHTGKPGEAEALEVLADILGGGSTSRLYRQLVVEQGIAAGAGAGYDFRADRRLRFQLLCHATRRHDRRATRHCHRQGDRRADRQGRHGRRTCPRQGAGARQRDLFRGQPAHARQRRRRIARHRRHAGGGAVLARAHRRSHGR